MIPERLRRRAGVIETDLGSELVLLDPATGQMYSLNPAGRLIWSLIDTTPLDAIARRIAETFETTAEQAALDGRALVDALAAAGLVERESARA